MRHSMFDGLAMGASGICLMHCLLLPVLMVSLPSGVQAFGGNEWFHVLILVFALPVSLFGLHIGAKAHHIARPMQIGLLGLGLLVAGVFLEKTHFYGIGLTVAGSLCLVLAHWINWKLRTALTTER